MLTSSKAYRRCHGDLVVVRRAGRIESRPMKPVQRVFVRAGPFRGVTGILVHQSPDRPAIVRVEVLGRPVDLEIELGLLSCC